jgi:hypothetical protein
MLVMLQQLTLHQVPASTTRSLHRWLNWQMQLRSIAASSMAMQHQASGHLLLEGWWCSGIDATPSSCVDRSFSHWLEQMQS